MPAVKAAKPNDIFSKEEWADLTHISPVRGLWLALHGWMVIAVVLGGTAWLWQWNWIAGLIATPFAIALVGSRQLGLSILMHEAAHGLLHPNRKINNFVGEWFGGAATGSDLQAYRTYHLTHHRFTQQDEDPDLSLSAPFPTTKASMKRKVVRDLTGQTFFKQRSSQFKKAWTGLKHIVTPFVLSLSKDQGARRAYFDKLSTNATGKRDTGAGRALNNSSRAGIGAEPTSVDGSVITAKTVGRFLLVHFIVLIVSLATLGIIPFLIWIVALATSFQLILRVRNIAEHACTTTGGDDPFSHARTTYASWWERAILAPYWVNYHSEHHLFMGVPCYNLAKANSLLIEKGYGPRLTLAHGYGEVIRTVTRPAPA